MLQPEGAQTAPRNFQVPLTIGQLTNTTDSTCTANTIDMIDTASAANTTDH